MTKAQHREKVINLLKYFPTTIKLSDDLIDRYVEHAVRRVWRQFVVSDEADFRKSVTVAHGDPLPADWGWFAGSAYYTVSGEKKPITFIQTQEISHRKTSKMNLATANRPSVYITNQTFKFIPDTTMTNPATGLAYAANLSSVTLWYYFRPTSLFGSAVADNTDDGMPEYTQGFIHRAAVEMCMEQLQDDQQAYQQIDKNFSESMQANAKFFAGITSEQMKSYIR